MKEVFNKKNINPEVENFTKEEQIMFDIYSCKDLDELEFYKLIKESALIKTAYNLKLKLLNSKK